MVRRVNESRVQLVFFLYCDNGGVIRGKSTHISRGSSMVTRGKRLRPCIRFFNMYQAKRTDNSIGLFAGFISPTSRDLYQIQKCLIKSWDV